MVPVVHERLHTGTSALNATGSTILGPGRASRAKEWNVTVEFGAGTSAGAVQMECAESAEYAGVWAAIGAPIVWVAASKTEKLNFTGVFMAIRARISTAIVGGAINVAIVGANL